VTVKNESNKDATIDNVEETNMYDGRELIIWNYW
jgi:hypothetical protein